MDVIAFLYLLNEGCLLLAGLVKLGLRKLLGIDLISTFYLNLMKETESQVMEDRVTLLQDQLSEPSMKKKAESTSLPFL